ncbi:MAG: efflux RND transporter periplasmic adaptor subunit [Steroidobacteraceae bacterium]
MDAPRFESGFSTLRLADSRTRWIAAGVAGLVVIVALVIGLRLRGAHGAAASDPAKETPLVTVSSAGFSAVTSRISFTGTIRARNEMPVGAEGDAGRVAAIYVEAGDRVRRGQVLARLDTSVLRPQVDRLAAQLHQARAESDLAAAEYRRAQGIAASGALSWEEVERRHAAAVTKEAQVRVAAAQLSESRARWQHSEIRAPENGTVLTRSVDVGQTVAPGSGPLFRLARDGQVEMLGQVAEQDLPRLAVGQPAQVHLTGVDSPFEGEVWLIGATIDPQTRLGDVRIALKANPDLRPGAFARAEVIANRSEHAVLPQTAILADAKGAYVLIVNGDHKVERRPVRVTGTQANGVVIGEGLNGSERVVTIAGAFLREGESVRVAGEQPPATAAAPADGGRS